VGSRLPAFRTGWLFDDERLFDAHCERVDRAVACIEAGAFEEALRLLDEALEAGESPNARWDRAQVLLALGRYREGFAEYPARWWLFPHLASERGLQLSRDLPPWQGEPLAGRRLVLIHESGFGDTIMMLRLLAGAYFDVALAMPAELERLASQIAPLVGAVDERDVACFTFDLPRLFGLVAPKSVAMTTGAYLKPDRTLVRLWRNRLKLLGLDDEREKIGVTWSSVHGRPHGTFAAGRLVELLAPHIDSAVLFALQGHDHEAARAHGIVAHAFEDFADVAALAALMDRVVSIDTAALHVAGAIGHSQTFAMLPHVPCWRWLNDNPWYPAVKVCRQDSPGDWVSAFEKLERVTHGQRTQADPGASEAVAR
jgi:tetratricopeptide (TPR) repeat protein